MCGFKLWLQPKVQNFEKLLALLLLGVVNASFLAEDVWGSTFGIYPLLAILLTLIYFLLTEQGETADSQSPSRFKDHRLLIRNLFILQGIAMTVILVYMIQTNYRLDYVDLRGPIQSSSTPSLKGLRTPGPWIKEMDQFLEFARKEIPIDERVLLIPEEDPFYFALQREPSFPLVEFNRLFSPFNANQLSEMIKKSNIKWLVFKNHLQFLFGYENFNYLSYLSINEFKLVKTIGNYYIFKRRS